MNRLGLWIAFWMALGGLDGALAQDYESSWDVAHDRRWVGPKLWANRLQDWRVRDGRLECVETRSQLPRRTVHLVGHRLERSEGFSMTVRTGVIGGDRLDPTAASGFLIGAGPNVDPAAAALVHHATGPGAGFFVGLDGRGLPFIVDLEDGPASMDSPKESRLPRTEWKVLAVDSVEPESPAANVLDGDTDTIWHTAWRTDRPSPPHEIQLDLGAPRTFEGLLAQPRIGEAAGRIHEYAIYASRDGESWGAPIAIGRWPDVSEPQRVDFSPVTARFLKLVARSSHRDRPSTTLAELWLLHRADRSEPDDQEVTPSPLAKVLIEASGEWAADGSWTLDLKVRDPESGDVRARIRRTDIPASRWAGNVALVSHPGSGDGGTGFWFESWQVHGLRSAGAATELGPILSTQYTLDKGVLKLTAQLFPIGELDNHTVTLEVERDGELRTIARSEVIAPGYSATFRVTGWDASRDTDYRVVYQLGERSGPGSSYEWTGTIRHDPVDQDVISVAAFTGNHNTRSGVDRPRFDWTRDGLWFPHTDITQAVAAQEPDLLFFSGDQIYEGASPTRADRSGRPSSYLDYLYKWTLWCWAYRDLTKDIPSIVVPDDHDIYQGNLWGQGGRWAKRDHDGGYIMPAEWVRMSERTQTSHLPDPFDPTPIDQGIGVYYTDLSWGGIGFAILEDRKFKSGPNGLAPPTQTHRPDHVIDPEFDPKSADLPGAVLLGERQLAFLRHWTSEWKNEVMKVALSQTIFGGLATHHGADQQFLVADYDSNGWPQTGRNAALAELRRAEVFMIGGDQHLSTIVQHGIDDWNDAGWSFCVPSVANFYPRAWLPKAEGKNRRPGSPPHHGEHVDGFGNRVTVHADTNPRSMNREPKALHDRMAGYGIIRFNKEQRTITMECWPRFADPRDPESGTQYEGWPKIITQSENDGRKPVAWLPELRFENVVDPVVEVIDATSGRRVYSRRISGRSYRPPVFRAGRYHLRLRDPEAGREIRIENLEASQELEARTVRF